MDSLDFWFFGEYWYSLKNEYFIQKTVLLVGSFDLVVSVQRRCREILFVNLTSVIDSGHVNEMLLKIKIENDSEFSFSYPVKPLPIALELFNIHRNRFAFHSL